MHRGKVASVQLSRIFSKHLTVIDIASLASDCPISFIS